MGLRAPAAWGCSTASRQISVTAFAAIPGMAGLIVTAVGRREQMGGSDGGDCGVGDHKICQKETARIGNHLPRWFLWRAQMTVISKGWKLRVCPLLAQSGHPASEFRCPLLGVKRTLP